MNENIQVEESITLIGYPTALPKKSDKGGVIQSISDSYIRGTVDSFGGNSGSPVFDHSGNLIGVFVAGTVDFVKNEDGNCKSSNVCPGGINCPSAGEFILPICKLIRHSDEINQQLGFPCDATIEEQIIEDNENEEISAEDELANEENNEIAEAAPEDIDETNGVVEAIDQEENDEIAGVVEAIDVEQNNEDDFVEDNEIDLSVSNVLLSSIYYLSNNIVPINSVNSNTAENVGSFQSFSPNISPLTSFHSPSDISSSATILIPITSILLVFLL